MSGTVEYRTLRREDGEGILRLYRLAEWVDAGETGEFISSMLSGSFAVLGAFRSGELIGMGRAISDGACDGYIQDVVVAESCRRQGIGGEIVRRLSELMTDAGVDWIGLIGAPGTESFYRNLGFEPLKEHIPMRLVKKKV